MAKNQNTYEKKRRESDKKRKAEEKRQEKQLRKTVGPVPPTPPDEAATEVPTE